MFRQAPDRALLSGTRWACPVRSGAPLVTPVRLLAAVGAGHVWCWTPVWRLATGGARHLSCICVQHVSQVPPHSRCVRRQARDCFGGLTSPPDIGFCDLGQHSLEGHSTPGIHPPPQTRNPRGNKHKGYSIPSARAHTGPAPQRCIPPLHNLSISKGPRTCCSLSKKRWFDAWHTFIKTCR